MLISEAAKRAFIANRLLLIARVMRRRGQYVTGKTARQLDIEVDQTADKTSFRLVGPKSFRTLIKGRGKTRKNSRGSKETSLVEQIREWIKNKGLSLNEYAVAKSIHKKGIKVPNRFNDGKLMQEAFNRKSVLGSFRYSIQAEIKNQLKKAFK